MASRVIMNADTAGILIPFVDFIVRSQFADPDTFNSAMTTIEAFFAPDDPETVELVDKIIELMKENYNAD